MHVLVNELDDCTVSPKYYQLFEEKKGIAPGGSIREIIFYELTIHQFCLHLTVAITTTLSRSVTVFRYPIVCTDNLQTMNELYSMIKK